MILQDLDQLRNLFEHAPVCIHEIDAGGCLLSMNRAGLDLLGAADLDEIVGLPYLHFVSADERQRIGCLLDRAFAGEASVFEFSVAGSEHPRYFTSCFIPWSDAAGNIVRLIGISADISLREEAQVRLRRQNRAQKLLARCNHNLARAIEKQDILKAFCDSLVDTGGDG